MKEETNLDVKVVSLLVDEPYGIDDPAHTLLKNYKTYLCEPLTSQASPGIEPEYKPELDKEGSHNPLILDVKWFDLRSEENWDSELVNDPIIYRPLQQIRRKLGY